jgi:hypothetical protein
MEHLPVLIADTIEEVPKGRVHANDEAVLGNVQVDDARFFAVDGY